MGGRQTTFHDLEQALIVAQEKMEKERDRVAKIRSEKARITREANKKAKEEEQRARKAAYDKHKRYINSIRLIRQDRNQYIMEEEDLTVIAEEEFHRIWLGA